MATNAELTAENAELAAANESLRARLAALEPAAGGEVARPAPTLPSFILSAGTVADIEHARDTVDANPRIDNVLVTEPYSGRVITVTADGATWDDGTPVSLDTAPGAAPDSDTDAGTDTPPAE